MEFNLMQFNAYIELLKEYNRTTSKKKKTELKEKMEIIRKGYMPINLKVK